MSARTILTAGFGLIILSLAMAIAWRIGHRQHAAHPSVSIDSVKDCSWAWYRDTKADAHPIPIRYYRYQIIDGVEQLIIETPGPKGAWLGIECNGAEIFLPMSEHDAKIAPRP